MPADLPKIEALRTALFNKIVDDPTNLDLAFRYAALSSRVGDLEGAIATLERMLIYAPGLPRLQLELGVLYFRLGGYETARTYFAGALSAPDVPPEVKKKVDAYLAAIGQQTVLDHFTGMIATGMRWQSNPSGAPENRFVQTTLFTDPLLLNEASLAHADVSGFLATNLQYSHDLASQGDRLEASLQTYGALYAQQDEINTALAELHVGPTFDLGRFDMTGSTLSTYLIASGLVLKDDPYMLSGGLGVALSDQLNTSTHLFTGAEYRREDFRNSDLRPTASAYTGDHYRAWVGMDHQITPDMLIAANLFGEARSADSDYLSFLQLGVTLGLTISLPSPIAALQQPWAIGLMAGYAVANYEEPDQLYSLTDKERDKEAFIQASLTVPVADNWAIQIAGGYRNIDSNYAVRSYDNIDASLGVVRKF